ncbi:hypothetical protein MAHJHV63_08280 [Mycobacterium avium subsp. hominissuis]
MCVSNDADTAKQLFREAMSRFPSGVTLVTTVDADGDPLGFTATAFAGVSVKPPLVLTCLDRTADCHSAFFAARAFAVNILGSQHRALALKFATKGADKFAGAPFTDTALGSPGLIDSVATVDCETEQLVEAGDHIVLFGRVRDIRLGEARPVVYADRTFHDVA